MNEEDVPSYLGYAVNVANYLAVPTTVTANLGGEASVDIHPIELHVDLPIHVGCFEVTDMTNIESLGTINPGWPAKCLEMCHNNDVTKRFALLKNGNECYCAGDGDFEPIQKRDEMCTMSCSHDQSQLCGGDTSENYMSVYVATCSGSEIRFSDHCYFVARNGEYDISRNADFCEEGHPGATLWWPESRAEVTFVFKNFVAFDNYHIGYRKVNKKTGVLHSDFSMGLGLMGVTIDEQGDFEIPEHDKYMTKDNCVILQETTTGFTVRKDSPCTNAYGVCKVPIGEYTSFHWPYQHCKEEVKIE